MVEINILKNISNTYEDQVCSGKKKIISTINLILKIFKKFKINDKGIVFEFTVFVIIDFKR